MFQALGRLFNAVGRLPIFRTRSTPDIDMEEVHRLRNAGLSWRQIARQLHGPRSTVQWRYERWLSEHPAPSPVAITQEPGRASVTTPPVALPASKPVEPKQPVLPEGFQGALSTLVQPGMAATPPVPPAEAPKVIAEPIAPEEPDISRVWGLETVPVGTRAFFLVNGERNASLASHMGQPAVGITEWRPEFWRIPQFDNAVKLWVVINMDEDNTRFLRSLADDERMKATGMIAPPRPWYTVRGLAKDRMLTMRRVGSDYRDDVDFLYQFQSLPPARHLSPWLRSPEPDAPQPGWIEREVEPWRVRRYF